jgi:hypothetical protein
MGANFHIQFKNKKLTQLFKRLCSTNQEKNFYEQWQKLDDLMKKASEEIAKKPISTEPGKSQFLWRMLQMSEGEGDVL